MPLWNQRTSDNGWGRYLRWGSLLVALLAWCTALAAQIVSTTILGRASVGPLWFAILLQLIVVLGVLRLIPLSSPTVAHSATACIVFGVLAIDSHLFSSRVIQKALGIAWLVLTLIDISWVVRLTHVADGAGVEGRSADAALPGIGYYVHKHGKDEETNSDSRASGSGSQHASPVGHPELAQFSDLVGRSIYPPPRPVIEPIEEEEDSLDVEIETCPRPHLVGVAPTSRPSSMNFGPPQAPSAAHNTTRTGQYYQNQRHLSTIYDTSHIEAEPEIDTVQDTNATTSISDAHSEYHSQPSTSNLHSTPLKRVSATSESDFEPVQIAATEYPFRVRAKGNWIPRSASELSFRKGEIMHSAERDRKGWWKVQRADGMVGSAPSNYLTMMEE
ncbi:unnamed protein product [Mycena citricolor]|uniref:SH3 domain-containing protein n=1 Tax=Mycena citricolor TaxID=2018698 RepID=A0AAD2Q0G4_9AGAR|nr:unnamed protein product [Mycena citricolor]